MRRLLLALGLLLGLLAPLPANSLPSNLPQTRAQALPWPASKLIFFDDFQTFSQRTGGPTEWGLDNGVGTWSTQTYYADAKGSNGLGPEFWLNQGYLCGGSNYDRISVSGGILTMSVLPTPAACTSAGISKSYLSAIASTRNSLLIKGEFMACARAAMPSTTGTIPAPLWSITRPPGPLDGNRARYEVDGGEIAGNATSTTTSAILGDSDNVAGGTYNSSPGNITHQTVLSAGFHTYCQWVKNDRVRFYLDGRLIRDVTASGTWFTTNRWHYLLMDLGLDDGSLFGAGNTYAGGAASLLIDWVRAWVPAGYVQGVDYIDRRAGDGQGVDLIKDPPSATSFLTADCGWYDQSTTTTVGTALNEPDEIKPSVVPSAGATWHGREGYCNSPTQVTNGVTYHHVVAFNYGTSNSLFAQSGPNGCTGNTVNITATGNTPTVTAGAATNVQIVDNPLGWKELRYDQNYGCTGNLIVRVGPNSATAGQNVTFYRFKIRP